MDAPGVAGACIGTARSLAGLGFLCPAWAARPSRLGPRGHSAGKRLMAG